MYFELCDKILFFFFPRQNYQVKIEFGTPGFLDPRASQDPRVITRKQTSFRNDLIKRAAGATW